jgi:hypothetical protein
MSDETSDETSTCEPPALPQTGARADDDREKLFLTNAPLYRRSQIAHLDRTVAWVWDGYIARGQLTLLTGQWKLGKTTLLAALLARMGTGGDLAGRRVTPGRAVVVTEEGAGLWLKRLFKHDIGEAVSFAFRPFVRKPLPRQWGYLLDDLADLNRQRPIDLVVLDPLAALLPGREEASAAAMTDALRPLRALAIAGPAVLILHHPPKGATRGGEGSRGTGALPAFVDFLVEMHWSGRGQPSRPLPQSRMAPSPPAQLPQSRKAPSPPAPLPQSRERGDDRQRLLLAWSRHDETPRRVLVELSASGTDYAVLPGGADEPNDELQRVLEELLRDPAGLTVREIVDRWPPGRERPSVRGLRDRLWELLVIGRLERSGRGDRFSPYRFFVPSSAKPGEKTLTPGPSPAKPGEKTLTPGPSPAKPGEGGNTA